MPGQTDSTAGTHTCGGHTINKHTQANDGHNAHTCACDPPQHTRHTPPKRGDHMATSRTGTTSYKHWRKQVLRQGQDNGVTHCPRCRTHLDYTNTRRPNSAEPDHIIPWANGGTNTIENGQILCRRCNQSLGNKQPRPNTPPKHTPTINYDWPPTT